MNVRNYANFCDTVLIYSDKIKRKTCFPCETYTIMEKRDINQIKSPKNMPLRRNSAIKLCNSIGSVSTQSKRS